MQKQRHKLFNYPNLQFYYMPTKRNETTGRTVDYGDGDDDGDGDDYDDDDDR